MQHIENALTVLAEWGKAPQCNGIVRGYVYDYDDQLIYRGNGAGAEWGGVCGVAAQFGREASLFNQNAAYFALVTDLVIAGTRRTMPIWCGSRIDGDCASANPILSQSLHHNHDFAQQVGKAFWQAYTQTESEYTQ